MDSDLLSLEAAGPDSILDPAAPGYEDAVRDAARRESSRVLFGGGADQKASV